MSYVRRTTRSADSFAAPITVYLSQDDRDQALDGRYAVRLDQHLSQLAAVDCEREGYARDFLAERDGGMWPGSLEDGLSAFLRHHLGHVEPAVLGLLLHEVGQYVLDERGRPLRRQGRPPVDWRHWQDATARAGHKGKDEPSLAYVLRICGAAGVRPGGGPYTMPAAVVPDERVDSRGWYDPQDTREAG